MPVVLRQVVCTVIMGGITVNNWSQISVTHSLNQNYCTAQIVLIGGGSSALGSGSAMPNPSHYDDEVTIQAGTIPGNGNALRFAGLRRNPDFTMWPRSITINCVGFLARAAEYINTTDSQTRSGDDMVSLGGLQISDLVPSPQDGQPGGARAHEIIHEVLRRANVPHSEDALGDTGRIYGLIPGNTSNNLIDNAFLWKSGLPVGSDAFGQGLNYLASSSGIGPMRHPGQTALEYIQQYDRVDAQADWNNKTGGFFRTCEALDGTVFRLLVGGRPRTSVSSDPVGGQLIFEENRTILEGTVQRQYPLGNRTMVTGAPTLNWNECYEAVLGSALQPESQGGFPNYKYDPNPISSEMITRSFFEHYIDPDTLGIQDTPIDPQLGMDCETVAKARVLDVSRETVQSRVTTAEDWILQPTQTHRVQGAAGIADRLGTGEDVWCTEAIFEISKGQNGEPILTQTVSGIGGGDRHDDTLSQLS